MKTYRTNITVENFDEVLLNKGDFFKLIELKKYTVFYEKYDTTIYKLDALIERFDDKKIININLSCYSRKELKEKESKIFQDISVLI